MSRAWGKAEEVIHKLVNCPQFVQIFIQINGAVFNIKNGAENRLNLGYNKHINTAYY